MHSIPQGLVRGDSDPRSLCGALGCVLYTSVQDPGGQKLTPPLRALPLKQAPPTTRTRTCEAPECLQSDMLKKTTANPRAAGHSLEDEDDHHDVEQDEVQLCRLVGHEGKATRDEWAAKEAELRQAGARAQVPSGAPRSLGRTRRPGGRRPGPTRLPRKDIVPLVHHRELREHHEGGGQVVEVVLAVPVPGERRPRQGRVATHQRIRSGEIRVKEPDFVMEQFHPDDSKGVVDHLG